MPRLNPLKKGDRISRAGKIKGSKISLVSDENGLPVNLRVSPAGQHDLYACGSIHYCIPRNAVLTADRGYDAKWFRQEIRSRGIQPVIPKRKMKASGRRRIPSPVTYKGRWVVERTFAWMEKFRKLAICYEKKATFYEAFWHLASAVLIMNRITG